MSAKVALITGGTSGIGRATAKLLQEREFQVVVTGTNERAIEEARADLPSNVEVLHADARSLKDSDDLAARIRRRYGTLSTVFLNAGVTRAAPIEQVTEELFDEVFGVNAKGQFFTLQKVLPLLADGGSIIFTIGLAVTEGAADASLATASRGALLAMVPSLALELAPRRIRVNAVSPGIIDTPLWAKSGLSEEQVTAALKAGSDRVPLGRIGQAEDIAKVVAFLASDASSYITGENVVVGGGLGLGV